MSCFFQRVILNQKQRGNIVQHQLDRLKELWETIAADYSWGNVRVLPQLHTLLYDNERGV